MKTTNLVLVVLTVLFLAIGLALTGCGADDNNTDDDDIGDDDDTTADGDADDDDDSGCLLATEDRFSGGCGADGVLTVHWDYSYDEAGHLLSEEGECNKEARECEGRYSGGRMETQIVQYKYYEDGSLFLRTIILNDAVDYCTAFYYLDGKLSSACRANCDSELPLTPAEEECRYYTYDSQGRLTRKEGRPFDYGDSWLVMYAYNERELVEEITHYCRNGEWSSSENFTYNEEGLVAQSTHHNSVDEVWCERYLYTDKLLSEHQYFLNDCTTGAPAGGYSFYYDEKGNNIREEARTPGVDGINGCAIYSYTCP